MVPSLSTPPVRRPNAGDARTRCPRAVDVFGCRRQERWDQEEPIVRIALKKYSTRHSGNSTGCERRCTPAKRTMETLWRDGNRRKCSTPQGTVPWDGFPAVADGDIRDRLVEGLFEEHGVQPTFLFLLVNDLKTHPDLAHGRHELGPTGLPGVFDSVQFLSTLVAAHSNRGCAMWSCQCPRHSFATSVLQMGALPKRPTRAWPLIGSCHSASVHRCDRAMSFDHFRYSFTDIPSISAHSLS